jgi:type VI secretion system protein ImpF
MDLTSVSINDSRSLRGLQDHLRKTIERFDPRLGGVKIALEPGKDGPRSIRFRVDAVLRLQPGRPPVTFDATLQMGTNSCTVQQR